MKTESHSVSQTTEGFNVIFIHSSLDDAGLSCQAFRVFGHLSRRASSGVAFPSIDTIGKVCRMHPDTVRVAVAELIGRNMVKKTARIGRTYLWSINPSSVWILDPSLNSTPPESKGGGLCLCFRGGYPPESKAHEGNPRKEIHLKEIQVDGDPKKTPIPESLNTTEFLEAWHELIDDRKERGKPLTLRASKAQLSEMSSWGSALAVQGLRAAVASGWMKAYPPRAESRRNGSSVPPSEPRQSTAVKTNDW